MGKNKEVFLIRQGKDKSYWSRVGVAFVNRDGSLNLKLDMFPNVQFQIRERQERNQPEKEAHR